MSITTDRPRTSSYRVHELSTTRHTGSRTTGSRTTGSRPARPLLLLDPSTRPAQPGQTAQPSVAKIVAGVLATAAILLGLVGIANLRATEPQPASPTTSSVTYDVGVAAAPVDANR